MTMHNPAGAAFIAGATIGVNLSIIGSTVF
jgi:hypothetical protein